MIASMIVEIEADAENQVLPELARMAGVSTYGVKEGQIVTVVEGASSAAVTDTIREIAGLERIIGVYPVFAGDHA